MSHALPKLQLSEPFQWFVLKMLEMPKSLAIFTSLGGINVLCQSLVRSNKVLINMQPGLVSIYTLLFDLRLRLNIYLYIHQPGIYYNAASQQNSKAKVNNTTWSTVGLCWQKAHF